MADSDSTVVRDHSFEDLNPLLCVGKHAHLLKAANDVAAFLAQQGYPIMSAALTRDLADIAAALRAAADVAIGEA